jgi:hypothetical protein
VFFPFSLFDHSQTSPLRQFSLSLWKSLFACRMEFSHGSTNCDQQWTKFWTNRTRNECSRGIINDRCGRQERVQQWVKEGGEGGRNEKVVTSSCALETFTRLKSTRKSNGNVKNRQVFDTNKRHKKIKRNDFTHPVTTEKRIKQKQNRNDWILPTINDLGAAARGIFEEVIRNWGERRCICLVCVLRNNHLSTSTMTTTSMPDRCNHFGRLY